MLLNKYINSLNNQEVLSDLSNKADPTIKQAPNILNLSGLFPRITISQQNENATSRY